MSESRMCAITGHAWVTRSNGTEACVLCKKEKS